MNKLAKESLSKIKQDIKNRYLAGESVPSIARSYDVVPRNIYYHLGKLSPQDKGLHIQNIDLQKLARKEKHAKKIKSAAISRESQGTESPVRLDDFK